MNKYTRQFKINILKDFGYLINIKNEDFDLPGYSLEDLKPGKEYYIIGGRLFEADENYIEESFREVENNLKINIKNINIKIKELEGKIEYCKNRDEVCCCFGSEGELEELERELEIKKQELEDAESCL